MFRPSAKQDVDADGEEQHALPVAGERGRIPDHQPEEGEQHECLAPPGHPVPHPANRLDDREPFQAGQFHARALPRVSPSRPLGRNISTRTRTTKAKTSFHSPPKHGCAVVLEEAQEQAAEERAADVADATEDGCRERFDARQEPDVEPGGLEEDREQEAAGPSEDATEEERERHDPVDVHAHELRSFRILRRGADAAAEPAAPDELVKPHHQDDRGHEDQHLVRADLRVADGEHRALLEHPLRVDLLPAVAQSEELLDRQRDADGGDQRGEAGARCAGGAAGRPRVP